LTQVATSIELSESELTFASLAATTQLTATVKDQNGATMTSATVTWATSDAAVATVSSTGLVTSVADGTATITATSGSANATAAVTMAIPAPAEEGQQGADYSTVTNMHLAVFVVDFPDTPEAVKANSFPSTNELADLMFGERMVTYLDDMSYGAFTVTGDMFGYFTHQNPGFVDGRIVELVGVASINSITVPGFDITQYDGVVLLSVHDQGLAGARAGAISFDVNGSPVPIGGLFVSFKVGSDCLCSLDPLSFSIPTGADAGIEGTSTIDFTRFQRTFAHELFHTLRPEVGLGHANSRTNGGSFDYEPEVTGNESVPGYSLLNREYGNLYDVMGKSEYGVSLNSVFRDLLGWTNQGNRYSIKSYGQHNVTIHPLNGSRGVRSIEIRIPYDYADNYDLRKNKGYFLEVRRGDDQWDNMLLHPELRGNNDGLMVLKTDGGGWPRLLDMSPSPNFPFYGQIVPDLRDVVLKPGMVYENDQIRLSHVVANGDGSFSIDVEVKR